MDYVLLLHTMHLFIQTTDDMESEAIKTTISISIVMHLLLLLGCVSFLFLSYKGKNKNNNEVFTLFKM